MADMYDLHLVVTFEGPTCKKIWEQDSAGRDVYCKLRPNRFGEKVFDFLQIENWVLLGFLETDEGPLLPNGDPQMKKIFSKKSTLGLRLRGKVTPWMRLSHISSRSPLSKIQTDHWILGSHKYFWIFWGNVGFLSTIVGRSPWSFRRGRLVGFLWWALRCWTELRSRIWDWRRLKRADLEEDGLFMISRKFASPLNLLNF